MEIRAAEISAILKKQIADFGSEADVAEVGQVLSVGDGIARVHGLDQVQAGEKGGMEGGLRLVILGYQAHLLIHQCGHLANVIDRLVRVAGQVVLLPEDADRQYLISSVSQECPSA